MIKLLAYFRRISRYLRPYWFFACGSALVALLSAGVGLLSPWPMKILVDSVLGQEPLPRMLHFASPLLADKSMLLIATVAAGLGITLGVNLLAVTTSYLNTKLDLAMTLDFRGDLFQQAQRLEMAYHDGARSGMVIYVINSMASAPTGLVMALLPLVQNMLTLAGMFWISFRLNSNLALLSLIVVPFLYYSVGYYTTHIRQRLMTVKGMEGETLSIIHEAVSMLRVIVAFGREEHEYERFREQGKRAIGARIRVTLRQALFSLAVNTTTAIGTAVVLGYGTYLALQRQLTVGELLIVVAYIGSVYKPLEAISGTMGAVQDHIVNLQIAFDLLDRVPDIADRPGAIAIGRAAGHVRFEGVAFNYPGRAGTLEDITLEASAGQAVAIVGPTGAGKSTLVSLLPRFYDPAAGRILLDGIDITTMTLKSLRAQISIVLQEPLLFSSTVAENIRYGRLDATMEDVIEAAKNANAHDFIMKLPQQYDTPLGERGAQLSGGERQRISVARAFLKDAPVLILDEPTSSIDSRTEAVILDALERLMAGRTTFLVAHRLSTLRNVHRVVVMNQGRIAESGTQQELLAMDGLYRQLHDVQNGAAKRRLQQQLQHELQHEARLQPEPTA